MFELSDVLEQNGHTVIPFSMADSNNTPSKFSKYFIKKVNVRKFSFLDLIKTFWNYDASRKLKQLIKAEKPDIAHLHNIHNHLSLSVIKVLHDANIPIVMTLHDYKFICPNRILYTKNKNCSHCQGHKYYNCLANKCILNSYAKSFIGMAEAYLNNRALKMQEKISLFIAPSRFIKNKFIEFGFAPKKIKVVNNFIDVDRFNLNVHSKKDYYLYFGRISQEKGIGTMIDAINKLDKKVKLKIIGAGPDYAKYKDKIKELELDKYIELPGPSYGKKLKDLIAGARAIIMPSLWQENFPYTNLESMASGKAVIASRIGGMTEMIEDGVSGYLFAAGDSQELAEKIEQVEKAGDLARTEQNAKEKAKRLNPGRHMKEILKIYKELVVRK